MRLNSALASSFLFVPIVLANWLDQVPWAGAVLPEGSEACLFRTGSYIAAIGSFNVPSASGEHGLSIVVGIGGRGVQCNSNFAVGIDVLVSGNVVSYTGWATWNDQVVAAQNFNISAGDTIQASVHVLSATDSSALLENFTKGEIWWKVFKSDEPVVCQQSAEWVVTALADYAPNEAPIPKFSEVTFVNPTAKIAGGASVLPGPGGANIINDIEYYNTALTTVRVDESTVVIAYAM